MGCQLWEEFAGDSPWPWVHSLVVVLIPPSDCGAAVSAVLLLIIRILARRWRGTTAWSKRGIMELRRLWEMCRNVESVICMQKTLQKRESVQIFVHTSSLFHLSLLSFPLADLWIFFLHQCVYPNQRLTVTQLFTSHHVVHANFCKCQFGNVTSHTDMDKAEKSSVKYIINYINNIISSKIIQ